MQDVELTVLNELIGKVLKPISLRRNMTVTTYQTFEKENSALEEKKRDKHKCDKDRLSEKRHKRR